jgi:hypothetical protein
LIRSFVSGCLDEERKEEQMQLPCSAPAREQFAHLEQLHRKLPSLSEIFAAWSSRSTGAWSDALALREHLLGAATLSSGSLRLLYDIANQFVDDLPARIYRHRATQSAAETQAVLPAHVFVQKTVSLDMAGKLLLWTSVGDQEQNLEQRRTVAALLGLPRRAAKQCSINPVTCCSEKEFTMLAGMVSPFLPPLHSSRLTAMVQVPWPALWDEQGKAVGVSLSLFESLLLPLTCFRAILRQYAAQAYVPALRWIELSSQDLLSREHEQAA